MFRVLTILAAVAALVLPAAHYIDDPLGRGARKLGASVALAAPGVATDEPDARAEVGLVYRGAVTVGEDGNGVRSARFATTVAGRGVRYVLLIENGCSGIQSDSVRPCAAPVTGLTVTLNEDVVFQNDDAFREARLEIPLNPDEADDNSLLLAARGAPDSAARVRILAIRQPVKPKSKPPVQVLGLVYRGAVTVGEDGNGVRSARFATTVAGRGVRYVLLIENGCSGIQSDSVRPCAAPVTGLTVTLNEDVVFQNDDAFREARLEIPLNPDEADDNSLLLAARGAPDSAARVRILAIRQPVKPKSKPPVQVLGLVYRGAVTVGEDGNGVRSARFATTVAGRGVRYVLLIENGCSGIQSDSVRPCAAPVTGLTVTLNEDVVFQNDDAFREARLEIPLNPDEADDNSLLLAARGAPDSAARVRILAIREAPLDQA